MCLFTKKALKVAQKSTLLSLKILYTQHVFEGLSIQIFVFPTRLRGQIQQQSRDISEGPVPSTTSQRGDTHSCPLGGTLVEFFFFLKKEQTKEIKNTYIFWFLWSSLTGLTNMMIEKVGFVIVQNAGPWRASLCIWWHHQALAPPAAEPTLAEPAVLLPHLQKLHRFWVVLHVSEWGCVFVGYCSATALQLWSHVERRLINIREDPVRDAATVCVPRQPVLGPALSLVPVLSVNQQDGEIYHVEVRQDVGESWGKRVN